MSELLQELNKQLNEAKLHSHMNFQGLDISIEIPAGGCRTGVNKKTGEKWSHKIDAHYGYIKGTHSPDGEHLDCYVRKNPNKSGKVYVMHQMTVDGSKFDEDKVMLGYSSKAEAIRAFKKFTFKPTLMYGGCTEFTMEHFKVVAYQASKSKAMLTDECTYEDFKKAGKLPSGVKSPVQIARRVSESLSQGLEGIGQILNKGDIAECLGWSGYEEGADLNKALKRAYAHYNSTPYMFDDNYLSEDEFRLQALNYIAEQEAYMTDTLDEYINVPGDTDNFPFIEFDDPDTCKAAYDFANEHMIKVSLEPTKLYFHDENEYESFISAVDISGRRELLGQVADDVMPETVDVTVSPLGETFAVVVHTQGMTNIGTERVPMWATTGDRVKLVQEGIESYGEARAIAAKVSAGLIPVQLEAREQVLGIDVIRNSEYRQFYEEVAEETNVEEQDELDEVRKLAGVKTGMFESRGTPSVHETRARLASLTADLENQLAEEEEAAKPRLSEEELERAVRIAQASIKKNPNHLAETVVKAVAKKLFNDVTLAEDIMNHMADTSEVVRFDDDLAARDILDSFASKGLITYTDFDRFSGSAKVSGSPKVIQRIKDELRGL